MLMPDMVLQFIEQHEENVNYTAMVVCCRYILTGLNLFQCDKDGQEYSEKVTAILRKDPFPSKNKSCMPWDKICLNQLTHKADK